MEYLYDHPVYLVAAIAFTFFTISIICLYLLSIRSRNKQKRISKQLAVALKEAKEANDAKFNFFSKMSHDIRTPLNAVLGMAVVKGFTDLMHGELSIQNEQGKGSTFIVDIPFEEATQKQRDY